MKRKAEYIKQKQKIERAKKKKKKKWDLKKENGN